ncbi:LamG domain-containing protein [Subtercola endophyticus]|uniref:LamG domain-containing protein n=1 Tax=Subtercola endophyticus TaxID=2895559 RepID=UPI001E48B8DC|nr:LamG domain-containing protein [Subtercola endophyticus]UFS59085.1 LamG domain-containing protein [Subtercola endophyticus]
MEDGQRAADTATAAAIAEKYDHAVADDSQTSETAQVSAQPDGSFTLESTSLPVRVQQDGDWVPVDSSLNYGADGMLTPAAAAAPVEFSEGGTNLMAKVEVQPGSWLTESWPYGNLPTPLVSDNDATYPNVLPGVDLRLSSTAAGMAEVLVVKTAQAAANPQLDQVKLSLDGATVTPSDGSALGVTPDGAAAQNAAAAADASGTVSSAPIWWDSQVKNSGPDGPVGAEEAHPLAQAATGDDVTLNVGDVVDTQKVTYPLYVDPDWSTGAQAYWFTDRAYPDTVYLNGNANSGGIQAVGYAGPTPNYLSHAFWQFNTAALNGKHILGASFNTYLAWSNSCTNTAVQAWVYGSGSASPGFTWNQEPNTWNTLMDTQTVSYGSSCSAGQNMGFNAVQGVVNAAAGGWSDLQIGLRAANESDPLTRKHFAETASLTVSYNTIPNKPTGLAISSPPRGCGTAASPAYLNSHQPINLRATVTDPDPQNIGAAFFVTNLDTGQNAFAPLGLGFLGTSSQAQGVQSVQIGASTLPEGRYTWLAQAVDYTDWGPLSDRCYFTVDNTAPALPVLTVMSSAPYVVGQPMTVKFTSVLSDHIVTFAYFWTSATTNTVLPTIPVLGAAPSCTAAPTTGMRYACADGSGASPSITVAPRDDTSTLWVVSFDAAGNASNSASSSVTSGRTINASPDANIVASKGHEWPMTSLSSIGASVADKNTTTGTGLTAQKILKIGTGTNVSVNDSISGAAHPIITLPGYVELARYYNGIYDAAISDGFAPAGYNFEVALGQYIPLGSAHDGMRELYSCGLSTGDMTSNSSTCEGTGATAQGFGYVWDKPGDTHAPAGTPLAPLYRCYIPSNGHHFDSPDQSCLGFTNDAMLGYMAAISPTVSANTAGSPAVLTPAPAIDTTKSFTVSAWLKLDGGNLANGNYTAMSEAGTGTNANSAFYLQKATGHWRFCVRTQAGADVVNCASTTAPAASGTWTMVTGIWDATNQEVRLLTSGSAQITDASTVVSHVLPVGEISATGPLNVGSAVSDGSPDNQWDGEISNPIAFQGVLDSSQLATLASLSPLP